MEKQDIKDILKKIGKEELNLEETSKAKIWLFQLNQDEPVNLSREQVQSAGQEIWNRLQQPKYRVRMHRLWYTWAAVASIVLIVLGGSLFYYQTRPNVLTHEIYGSDVEPGKDGATLTLANGTDIAINEMLSGEIAQQAGLNIYKDADGHIVYEVIDESPKASEYNTLRTTRGEHTKVKLPDGTIVALNAASSLRYPTNLANSKYRQVVLEGEGYFQVARDTSRPFVVETDDQRVEVLGTKFNVNSYNRTRSVTTLKEGSVRVSNSHGSILIRPGQQAINAGHQFRVQEADMDQVFGWKDGNFVFSGANIQSIMEQLGYWYDVEVIYDGAPIEGLFYANISRNKNISEILQVLEKTQGVHFKIQGRRVYVSK